jgi:hypothetical protein
MEVFALQLPKARAGQNDFAFLVLGSSKPAGAYRVALHRLVAPNEKHFAISAKSAELLANAARVTVSQQVELPTGGHNVS